MSPRVTKLVGVYLHRDGSDFRLRGRTAKGVDHEITFRIDSIGSAMCGVNALAGLVKELVEAERHTHKWARSNVALLEASVRLRPRQPRRQAGGAGGWVMKGKKRDKICVPEDAMRDSRILLGVKPFDGPTNYCYGDGYFAMACERKYGKDVFDEALRREKRGTDGR